MKDRLLRLPVIGTALRVQQRYVDDAADALAAAIGLFGFLSLFPLLAIVVAVLAQVVGDDPALQAEVLQTIQESIPVLASLFEGGDGSDSLATALEAVVDNAGSIGLIGGVLTLVAGLRIASGCQQASAVVFRKEIPTGPKARLMQLAALIAVGALAVTGAAVGGSVGVNLGAGVESLAVSLGLTALTIAIDISLFALAYRLFTPGLSEPPWRTIMPGAILGGLGWVGLKIFGTSIIAGQADRAGAGALGGIIGLAVLFYIAGRLYLYGAELAAVLGGIDDQEEDSEVDRTASPRPVFDERPAVADLAKLAGTAAVVTALVRAADRGRP